MKRSLPLLVMIGLFGSYAWAADKQIIAVIPSYNNIRWYQRNLEMLFAQEEHYKNWSAIYIDDCSTDGTAQAVEQYVKEHHFEHKVTVIKNAMRKGALANLYSAIHACVDDAIIVTYDGDDFFKDSMVFAYLNQIYQNDDVWLTYGQYEEYPSGEQGICVSFPDWVIEQSAYRKVRWASSHLRTFYAWLFKRIKKEDLLFKGNFFPMTWDLAIMFPMLEMAQFHVKFIDRILYIYNMDNPINDYKKDLRFMYELNNHIRSKPSYKTYIK